MKPAEAFPVRDFVIEEMEARAWTKDDLLDHMPGKRDENEFMLELILCEPEFDPCNAIGLHLGENGAKTLAHAFGTSKELWLNLDDSYQAHLKASVAGS